MTSDETGRPPPPAAHARRYRRRAGSAPGADPGRSSDAYLFRTSRSGSSGPSAPPVAGPLISPPSSAAPHGPPRSPPIKSASTNSPGAPPGRPPASTGRPRPSTACACNYRRPLGLARHRARLPRRQSARIPPARASSSTPNTSPSAPTCPPRGRTSSTSPDYSGWRLLERDPRPHLGRNRRGRRALSGSRRPARRRSWGGCSPFHDPRSPRRWRDSGRAVIPTARWSHVHRASAFRSGAGAPRGARPVRRPEVPTRFLHDCRRTAARNLTPREHPRTRRHATGDRARLSRAIFDR